MSINFLYMSQNRMDSFEKRFHTCFDLRLPILSAGEIQAVRLFNGFYEGIPGLIVDLYKTTLLISNHSRSPEELAKHEIIANTFFRAQFPEIQTVLLKRRHAPQPEHRKGLMMHGTKAANEIIENGTRYAIDLSLNQDTSFYIDTRNLRTWLYQNCNGKSVLNTFAYTGALGVAALAGGAHRIIQTDQNSFALKIAKKSAALNSLTDMCVYLPLDFFEAVSRFKTSGELFDCVILDPPLFSSTPKGRVSLLQNWVNLINKARPLVAHEGAIVVINNALFLSGQEVMDQIHSLENSGYVKLETLIPVPSDVTGYPQTITRMPPVPTAPFNHPTKIAILRISRKDRRSS